MALDLATYTRAIAEALGIELDSEEFEAVLGQVERVADLVDRLPRVEDDAVTMAPRFEP